MYKLLVLDLDDTLLNSQLQISQANVNAIMQAQEKGVKVVLASGRPTCGMLPFAEQLKLADYDSAIISYNGGEIVRCSDQKIMFAKSLQKEEVQRFYEFSRQHNADIITYRGDAIITEDESEYIDVEKNLLNVPLEKVPSFCEEVNYEVIKCILLQEPTYLAQVKQKMHTEFPNISLSISKPFFLEVTAPGIDKGHTLDKLCAHYGIKAEETIAIGNAENDLSMIEYAGLGIWVENTDAALKPLGNAVVASNDEDGVAKAIEKYILA